MLYTTPPQKEKERLFSQAKSTIYRRSQGEVGQDSIAESAIPIGSRQPASDKKVARGARMRTKPVQAKTVIVEKNRTEPTTVHMEPILKRQLLARAAGQTDPKLTSFSGIANAMIRRGMHAEPDKPYGPSLEPVLKGAVDKSFSRHDNRLAPLQAWDTRDSAQGLHLQVQAIALLLEILEAVRREPIEPDAFDRIIKASEQHGRDALTKRDPYLLALVRELFFYEGRMEER